MKKTLRILTTYLSLLLPLWANAQATYPQQKLIDAYRHYFDTLRTEMPMWEAGLNMGFSRYDGDIEQTKLLPMTPDHVNVGGFLRLRVSEHLALRGNVYVGRLCGSDVGSNSSRAARGFSFKSSLKEFSGQLEFFPLGQYKKKALRINGSDVTNYNGQKVHSLEKRRIVPYAFVGAGLSIVVPRTDYNLQFTDGMHATIPMSRINADRFGYKPNIVAVIPFGGGIKWNVGKNAAISLEGGFRASFSDYLDGIRVTGNPKNNDWYFTGSAQISYTFGKPKRKDDDGDGTPNAFDKCLTQAGAVANMGCPIVEKITERPIADQNMPKPIKIEQKTEPKIESPVPVQKVEVAETSAPKTEQNNEGEMKIDVPSTESESSTAIAEADVTAKSTLDLTLKPVYFGTNKIQSEEEFYRELDRAAIIMLDNPEYNLNISGHTDNVGNAASNMRLSKSRAEYCRAYLIKAGVDPKRILTEGFGSNRPAVVNDSEANRQLNRRVEFILFQRE
jgi:outer membrane protein OmpA-like peptidoglycan-associated protein